MRVERPGPPGLPWRALLSGLVTSLLLVLSTLVVAGEARATPERTGLRLYAAPGQAVAPAAQLATEVAMRVTGMINRVVVAQRFRNPHSAWVEGVYVFPLPESAAVDRLRLRYAGRLIEGEIQAREEARRTYETARTRGQGASLLDQQRANVFTTSVANIPPGGEVLVEIEYQEPVRWADGEFSLRFPMVVAPRYIPGSPLPDVPKASTRLPGWAPDTDQVPDAADITPPVVAGADDGVNPLRLHVDLDPGLALAAVDSPYHAIDVDRSVPGRYRVTLATGSAPAERDFVLRWRPQPEAQPDAALFAETWRDRHYGLLMLMPPADAARYRAPPRELILVVDTSGSMHGDSIVQARALVLGALQLLRPGDRFNVIRFNDRSDALFERPAPADPANLRRAVRYVNALSAEGGTEMLPAMQRALHDPWPSGLLRQVVFLTDGAVGNEEALFRAVADGIGASRLFTVGIGAAPNALFMTRAAAFGRGTFTYVGSTAEVGEKVSALFAKISAPVLTDIRVRWYAGDAEVPVVQAPSVVPDLYAGEPLTLAVEAAAVPQRVVIEGRLGGESWRHSVALQGGARGLGVHALWARRLIEDWLARLTTGSSADDVRSAVLDLALRHHLVSRYTSLVAVDRTPSRPAGQDLESAALPTRLPVGWSADAVFGRLPSTATPALLYLLAGLAGFAAWLAARRWA